MTIRSFVCVGGQERMDEAMVSSWDSLQVAHRVTHTHTHTEAVPALPHLPHLQGKPEKKKKKRKTTPNRIPVKPKSNPLLRKLNPSPNWGTATCLHASFVGYVMLFFSSKEICKAFKCHSVHTTSKRSGANWQRCSSPSVNQCTQPDWPASPCEVPLLLC